MTPDLEEQDIVTESWLPELILHPASEVRPRNRAF